MGRADDERHDDGDARHMGQSPGRNERHRTQARAAHRRLLDPQGRRDSASLIFEACIGKARDTVVLKLSGAVPANASLWYGYGMDPYCNLVDGSDMAVPVFGPIARFCRGRQPRARRRRRAAAAAPSVAPVKVLIITGDNVSAPQMEGERPRRSKKSSKRIGPHQGRHHGHAVQGPHRRKPGQIRCPAAQLQGNAERTSGVALVGFQQGRRS